MRPRGPNSATCQNPSCDHYHKEEGKEIIRKGKNRSGRQEYLCLRCKTRFSETTNTPLHRKRLADEEIHGICRLSFDRNGNRAIERMIGHRRETIGRLLTDLAEDPRFLTKYLLGSRKFTTVEVHELVKFMTEKRNGSIRAPEGSSVGKEE